MRPTPVMAGRPQQVGRQMPAWFSTMNQARASPPPLPEEPPPTDESEYEEIDELTKLNGFKSGRKRACGLCGNANAVVACEMCEDQIFCGPCNDMYHRHPKRLHHMRKLLERSENGRPPLPPKSMPLPDSDVPTQRFPVGLPPVPPPRRQKRFPFITGMRSAESTPTLVRKTFDPVGTLKRFVGNMAQRPLPAVPKPPPPLPPKPVELGGRPTTPTFRGQQSFGGFDRRNSSPAPSLSRVYPHEGRNNFPHPMQEFGNRNQSISVANLSMQRPPSRNNGFPEWEDEDRFLRQRAQSVSISQRFPTSAQDASHFATLQRGKRGSKGAEPLPPPLPPRSFPSQTQLAFQSSQSAFNLHQMGMMQQPQFGMPAPWGYPYPGYPNPNQMDFQQMGYPGGTMRRTPSNQSMGPHPYPSNQFAGWAPMGFGPPMTQQEMEMDLMARRGAEQAWPPASVPPPRPPSVTQSQPVTPRGSFRQKSRPPMAFPQNEGQRGQNDVNTNERRVLENQRASTPRGMMRVTPSPTHFQPLSEDAAEVTESPEGPWTCEHCTFINAKSSKICTICCKTPSEGYKSMVKGGSRKGSTSSTNENEEVQVIQSKLCISRGEKQQATINLVESVERVRTPTEKRRSSAQSKKEANLKGLGQENEESRPMKVNPNANATKPNSKKPVMTDSNEDVYGSVPVQAMTISPKIEIRRHPKPTPGAPSSPPKPDKKENIEQKQPPKKEEQNKREAVINSKSKRSSDDSTGSDGKSGRNGESSGKSPKSNKSKIQSNSTKQGTSSSLTPKHTKKKTVSSGTQAGNGKRESGNESNQSSSESLSSEASSSIASEAEKGKSHKVVEKKSSKGTSPPPQSISTQTYDELPSTTSGGISRLKSGSKTSMTSLQSDEYDPPKPVHMSEKAMRYARKANRHHHQAKLKRSMSTHLASGSDPWVDHMDGRGVMMYRSSSRHSLLSDTRSLPISGPPSRESSPPRGGRYFDEFRAYPPPWNRFPTPDDYFASMEDLVSRRRKDPMSQEVELSRMLKEAVDYDFTPEDIQVALKMCGDRNPVKWLQENWSGMVETVQTLATKYGREKGEKNQTGTVSSIEAKLALRANKGNVWAAVTECIEQRRKKFLELQSKGSFSREDILTALTANHGNIDAAYVELSKAQLKPFLMRIWGAPAGPENESSPADLPVSKIKSATETKVITPIPQPELLQKLESNSPSPNKQEKAVAASQNPMEGQVSTQETKKDSSRNPSPNIKDAQNAQIESDITESFMDSLPNSNIKSDEEESFADAEATLDSELITASPLPSQETETFDEFEDDEDILEIEIDDAPSNISELVQNYEVVPAEAEAVQRNVEEKPSNQQVEQEKVNEEEKNSQELEVSGESRKNEGENSNPNAPISDHDTPNRRLSTVEIEHLLTTLTTTFTEMGQFANDIKAQIATEIQQQLAAVNVIAGQPNDDNNSNLKSGEKSVSNEQIYEPVDLPNSISETVNKKIAKYKKVAAKKGTKGSNRHKSPDARLLKTHSPSPSSSVSEQLSLPFDDLSTRSVPQSNPKSLSPFKIDAQVEVVDADSSQKDGTSQAGESSTRTEKEQESQVFSNPEDEDEVEEIVSGSEEEEEEENGSEEEEEISEELEESGSFEEDERDYEDVDITQASDFEIYNNKDTEKPIADVQAGTENYVQQNLEHLESNPIEVQLLSENVIPEEDEEPQEPKSEKEMKIEQWLKEKKVESVEKGHLAFTLVDMNFTEDDSFQAATECSSLEAALSFLQQECDLCAGKFSARQMVSMLRCTHVCCQTCAKDYFTVQIRDKAIVDATCPFCGEPNHLGDGNTDTTDYFTNLDILLKSILEPQIHEMFQRKLRDWALAKTPNFKWCSKCSSGFITEPLQTRLICPDCNAVTCAICLEQWDKFNHGHKESKVKVCDSASKTIVDYLNENSIECPRCHFRFALARGGCMHLTCTQCRHEFCSGCSASFRMGSKCEAKLAICERLGLHAHHPRNCLFYLRDKEPEILCKLLEDNAIPYLKENSGVSSPDSAETRECQVSIQKETAEGLKDDICGKDAPEGYATVCKAHYVEYLGLLIWQNHLDPISILSSDDLEVIIRRANKKHPGRPYPTSDEDFRKRLLKVIQEEIPLQ